MGLPLENMLLTMYLYFALYFLTTNIYKQSEVSFGLHHMFKQSSILEGEFNVCELFVVTLSINHGMKIMMPPSVFWQQWAQSSEFGTSLTPCLVSTLGAF